MAMGMHRWFKQAWLGLTARGTVDYWDRRYRTGLDSGDGSRGALAEFKAGVLNAHVSDESISSVIELGCGDGQQLALARYPSYLGLDVSPRAVDLCLRRFGKDESKSFAVYDPSRTVRLQRHLQADLTLSLDVIYHLLEDSTYSAYLELLFGLSRRWTIIYSSDREASGSAPHVRHHRFTTDVSSRFPEFELVRKVANPYPDRSFADFYVYRRRAD